MGYITMAARTGLSQRHCGAISKDELEAVKWFRIAADGGYRQAAELLGKSYSEGLLGLPRDQEQSEYWFHKAKGL
jgi:uncharacterized protein